MLAASQESTLFDRLVMVDPVLKPPRSALGPDPERDARVSEMADRARRRRQVFESRQAASESWREKAIFASWTQRAFDLYLAEGLADRPDGSVQLKCPGEVEGAIFAAGPDFDFWEVAPRVKTPALLLWAERGDFGRSVYESVAERMADAQVRDVGAGHLVPMERPDLVVDAVLDFAGRAADQRSTG